MEVAGVLSPEKEWIGLQKICQTLQRKITNSIRVKLTHEVADIYEKYAKLVVQAGVAQQIECCHPTTNYFHHTTRKQ